MAKNNTGLTNVTINAAKPKEKLYTLFDVTGLRLLIRPSDRKVWTFNYTRKNGKKTSIT